MFQTETCFSRRSLFLVSCPYLCIRNVMQEEGNIAKMTVSPQEGFQERFVRSDVDVVFGGGVLSCGKSFAAILSVAEPSLDPNFRACFTRRTFGELRSGGGLMDDFTTAYGEYVTVVKSDPPRAEFPCGSFVEMRQINNEDKRKITESWKGSQYDLIYMDELTSYEFSTFKYLLSRNRGKGKWTGKFRGTTNPEKMCWVRDFIDWYVGIDGQIIPERDGVVRYFYINGETISDVVWGDTKEEVYDKCKIDIDRKLSSLNGRTGKGVKFTYDNLIKSFTFYLGKMSENRALMEGNMDYAGSVAAVGGRQAQQLIEGNWNVSSRENTDIPIPTAVAQAVFMADEQRNGDMWITADLADTGSDNTNILVWDGLHLMDLVTVCVSTPRQNAEILMTVAHQYGISDRHIIFDATRAMYIKDYIPDAEPFLSSMRPVGLDRYNVMTLKDECFTRLISILKRGMMSVSTEVAKRRYQHVNLKTDVSFQVEFIEETSVVNFRVRNGRKTLLGKKEMNIMLGKGRSMDVLDPCAYRMYPLLQYEYGDELVKTAAYMQESERNARRAGTSIYDNSFWC